MRINDLPLSAKLWGLLVAVLAALTAVAAFNQRTTRQVHEDTLVQLRRADDLITKVTVWRALSLRNTEQTLASFLHPDEAGSAFFGARLKNGIAESSAVQKQVSESATTERDKAQASRIVERRNKVLALLKQTAEVRKQGDMAAVKAMIDREFLPAVAFYDEAQAEMVHLQEVQRDEALADAGARLQRATVTAIALMAAVLGAALVAMKLLLRSIVMPLGQTVEIAERIATGDLRQVLATDRRDEVGRLLQAMGTMTANLRHLVQEVRQGVGSVDAASSEIASGNNDLSVRTEQTASRLQQTAASLEQVTGTIRQSAEHADQADQLAASTQAAATRSGEAVGEVVGRMQEISESSRRIADITNVIDGIAFQTNILALNAAVEAARAGEQGRGFAVVAGEVRTLAQRSAEAAKEIRQLITRSAETVDAGSRQVNVAKAVIDEVVTGVRRVAGLIGELANASTGQRDGIQQVNQAVANIDDMTQQNAALVEEAAAAAMSLRDQSKRLAGTVAVFKTEG